MSIQVNVKENNTIEILGNLSSVLDYNKIRSEIIKLKLQKNDSLIIYAKDSLAIPSSIIGYFLKLVKKDEINLSIRAGDISLVNLLEDLKLTQIFNVTKA